MEQGLDLVGFYIILPLAAGTSRINIWPYAVLGQRGRNVSGDHGGRRARQLAAAPHFSRTIDRQDTALCARLVVVAGRYGEAVS
jgi:hypothetical protein